MHMCEKNSLPGLLKISSVHPFSFFEFKYSYYSIGRGKSLPILCGPPISLETKINYPYLHD